MAAVTIGPEFFRKSLNEYSDWRFAFGREFMQNGIDAGASKIEFSVSFDGVSTTVVCENDGSPMSEEVLVGKFLALGGSGKGFEGTVGGFGQAKLLLAYAHRSYSIETGDLWVEGVGGNYDLMGQPFFAGTRTRVVLDGDERERIEGGLRRWALYSQWGGTLLLNGERLSCDLRKGSRRREFGFGVVYSNKSFENLLLVRVNGMLMFSKRTNFRGCVVVELLGESSRTLQSSRDGLKWPFCGELDGFIESLTVDKRSALRGSPVTTYERFEGRRLGEKKVVASSELVGALDLSVGVGVSPASWSVSCEEITRVRNLLGHSFVLKNETGLEVPEYYKPSDFSDYSLKVARAYGRAVVTLMGLFGRDDEFEVGFVFTEDAKAEYDLSARFGHLFLINPCEVVKQSSSASRSFRKRFKLDAVNRWEIVALAAHEFTHYCGFSRHDEDYSSKLTEILGVCLRDRQKFNWCFQ